MPESDRIDYGPLPGAPFERIRSGIVPGAPRSSLIRGACEYCSITNATVRQSDWPGAAYAPSKPSRTSSQLARSGAQIKPPTVCAGW